MIALFCLSALAIREAADAPALWGAGKSAYALARGRAHDAVQSFREQNGGFNR